MDTNEKIKIVGTNIQEKANLIWNVANSLFGAYSLMNMVWLFCPWS